MSLADADRRQLARSALAFNAPLGDARAARLVEVLSADAPSTAVDLGCGTGDEWDDFESRWRQGLELSDDDDARTHAAERRSEYLEGYRGVLGFAWLVLAPG